MAEHVHDFYAVQFSYAGWIECECGYRPTEAEWFRGVPDDGEVHVTDIAWEVIP